MKTDKFLSLLTDDKIPVTVRGGKKEIRIEPEISISFSEDFTEEKIEVRGFEIKIGNKGKSVKTPAQLFKRLEKLKAVKNGEVFPVKINDEFSTLEEYEEKIAFDSIDMAGLLKMYLPLADSFSLTCPYNDGFDEKHQSGIYNLSEELADKALAEIEREQFEEAEKQFKLASEKERAKLPSFETLYKEIKAEYEEYYKKHLKTAEENGGAVFFCDVFATGKAKYKKPMELWHAYHAVDFTGACAYSLGEMKKNTLRRPIDSELDDAQYRDLKHSLIKTDVTFCWHCTTSSLLSKVFHFKLNDKTAEWLSKRKNDYDFNGLDDLAFYKDGEVIFSSCTHEGFHTAVNKLKR